MADEALLKTVTAIMDKNLIVVAIDDPIEKVERFFRIHRHAYATVLDEEGDYFGLICVSNLLEFQLAWKNIGALNAGDICVRRVFACNAATSIRKAAELMARKNAEYLVVMEEQQILGVVSLAELFKLVLNELDPTIPGASSGKGYFAGMY